MTDQGDFHCILTSPDSNFDYEKKETDSDDFLIPLNRENVPIIVLLGWSGALDKHLQVYSKIYEEKGFVTLRHISPVLYSLLHNQKMLDSAKKIVDILNKPNLEKRDIIIHAFSNGGSFEYEFVVKALENNSTATQLKGVIFDSAPGELTFRRVYGAVNSMKRDSNTFWSKAESFSIVALHFARKAFNRCYGKLVNKDIYEFNPIKNLMHEENRCPQHFIYSKADALVAYEDIERFMKYRKSIGVDISSKAYEDTPHVRHYPFNKLSYQRSIFQFLSKCLRR